MAVADRAPSYPGTNVFSISRFFFGKKKQKQLESPKVWASHLKGGPESLNIITVILCYR